MIRRFLAITLLAIGATFSHAQPSLPSSFQGKTVHSPEAADIFVRWGGKGPVVVLIHGYAENSDSWAPLAADLVATSREANRKLTSSGSLVLLDGDIGEQQTAAHAVEAAISNFGAIDVLVNNAGIFLNKPFTDFTAEDFDALVSTNLLGFFYVTQRTVKEMLKQKSGCVVSITAALADRPIAGENGSISMITKGGLNSATQNLAIEYEKDGIRFNAVAPGVVDTQMHRNDPNDSTLQPSMKKATVKDIVDAVLYLAQAGHVSGEILHVDGAAPARRW